MADQISFIFTGKIADHHEMDFYEAARFQYAAARLSVKLDRFRRTGEFPKKVTRQNNTAINVRTYQDGSFLIDVIAPTLASIGPSALEIPLTALWTYVIERIFKPADDEAIKRVLDTQSELIGVFDRHIAASDRQAETTLAVLAHQLQQNNELNEHNRQLYERLLAETERRAYLQAHQEALSQITPEQDAELVTMAAPLLKELAVPLRRSADTANILVQDGSRSRPILSANRAMAEEVEAIVVDPNLNLLLINIIQYNKENGWGKFRNVEFDGPASFSVPTDRKDRLKSELLQAMDKDEVYVQAYYVKSIAGKKLRIIIVDFIDIDLVESGMPPK